MSDLVSGKASPFAIGIIAGDFPCCCCFKSRCYLQSRETQSAAQLWRLRTVTWGIFITRKYWQINDEEGEEIPMMFNWSTVTEMINGGVCFSEDA